MYREEGVRLVEVNASPVASDALSGEIVSGSSSIQIPWWFENWLMVRVNPHAHVKIGFERNLVGVRDVRVARMAQVQNMWLKMEKPSV